MGKLFSQLVSDLEEKQKALSSAISPAIEPAPDTPSVETSPDENPEPTLPRVLEAEVVPYRRERDLRMKKVVSKRARNLTENEDASTPRAPGSSVQPVPGPRTQDPAESRTLRAAGARTQNPAPTRKGEPDPARSQHPDLARYIDHLPHPDDPQPSMATWNSRLKADLNQRAMNFINSRGWFKQDFLEVAFVFLLDHLEQLDLNEAPDAAREPDPDIARKIRGQLARKGEPDPARTRAPGVARKLAHEEMRILFKTRDDIIIAYEELTGNRFKPSDDHLASQFNDQDIRKIKLGIMQTVLQSGGKKTYSFGYYVPEIEEVLMANEHASDERLDGTLQRRQEQCERLWKEKSWKR